MRLSSRLLRQIAGCLVISSLAAGAERAQPGPDANTAPPQAPSGSPQAASPPQQPAVPRDPVGTAAAPYERVTGVPASRPAGAAIAPAKQKRSRSILIRVGLIAAAGVAIGTVVALSTASSSKPH